MPFESLAASRIVVLDDDAENVVLLERLLRRAGYTSVEGLTDAAAALDALAADPPDLLLLDLHMPHPDGFAVLERLARHISGPSPLPVIVLSADMTVQVKRRALAAGACDFLTKPYDLHEVLLRVGNLVETRYLHRRVHEHNLLLEAGYEHHTDQLTRIAGDLGHEVRTPLYAIRGLAEVLLHFEQDVPERLRGDVQAIDTVAAEALAVVNQQIATARTAAGRTPLAPGPVHVDELFAGLAGMMEPLARAQGTQLVVEPPDGLPLLHTDGLLLAQILRNLAANAIRHTPAGTVRIAARLVGDGDRVAFEVEDTGVGIHPEDQERIFVPFERVGESESDGPAGGLGLALARRLARLLGGDVKVVSSPGGGSTFTATIDRGEADPDHVPYVV